MRYRMVVKVTMGSEHVLAQTDEYDDALAAARARRDAQEDQIRRLGGFTPAEGVRIYDGDEVVWTYKWPVA